jgi:hypothetical protein
MAKNGKSQPPEVFNSIGHSGSGQDLRWWATLFRNPPGGVRMRIERQRGPFMTRKAAAAAFLPIDVWPRYGRPPKG